MPDQPTQTLVVVLGDQLSFSMSSLRRADKATSIVLMAEVMAEATYARHHKKKLIFVFSAMRHFAEEEKKRIAESAERFLTGLKSGGY